MKILVLIFMFFAPLTVSAQSQSPKPGEACSGSITYGPDASGYMLKCFNSVWVAVGLIPPVSGAAAPLPYGVTGISVKTYCASGCTVTCSGDNCATYTPPSNLLYAFVEAVGGGGGGGGCTALNVTAGGGGGGGGYVRALLSSVTSQSISVSTGAAGGLNTGAKGDDASPSSFGSLVIAYGGSGGAGSTATNTKVAGGAGGSGTGGLVAVGRPGQLGNAKSVTSVNGNSGTGGSSALGGGGRAKTGATGPGNAGGNYGGGGGGAKGVDANAGGAGGPGIVIVTEYTY